MESPLEIEQDNIEEFCNIIKLLVSSNLSVLHEVLLIENEKEQFICLRRNRNNIAFYSTLYNAYSARTLVSTPNDYISNEIINRFKNLYIIKMQINPT